MSYLRLTPALCLLGVASCAGPAVVHAEDAAAARPPNFVIIFVDDMGYGDIGPFGSTKNRTPHLDTMARQGMLLTSFYAAPSCTPSRASLMTGCYPPRVGLAFGSWHGVLQPGDRHGIHADEVTLAEVLQQHGYRTACIGKWHLGDQPKFLPTRHGFDEFVGLPYSNDMRPRLRGPANRYPPLPLLRQDKVVRPILDQAELTGLYTREAVAFIERNKSRPFFLYLPHTMVHLPLHAGPEFKGKSSNGILGDAIEEIDWSTGEILAALRKHGLDANTLVLFTSDNGPARGSAGPLRGRKAQTWEGGMREPCIVRWPGRIAAGSHSDAITSTMDLLPTFARLAGAKLSTDRRIDGGDIAPLLLGEVGAKSPYEAFFYYRFYDLKAVRSGSWKLHNPTRPGGKQLLYNLDQDIAESHSVLDAHPDIVARLNGYMQRAQRDLGDAENPGPGRRPVGIQEHPAVLMPRPDGSLAPVSPRPRRRKR